MNAMRKTKRQLANELNDANSLKKAGTLMRQNKDVVRAAYLENPSSFRHASIVLKRDLAFVEELMRIDGSGLQFAAPICQDNYEVVSAAIRDKTEYVRWASPRIRADKEYMIDVLKKNGRLIIYMNDAFKADRDILFAAVSSQGHALGEAAFALKCDKELARIAIEQTPTAICYVRGTLSQDLELAELALKNRFNSAAAYRFFPRQLYKNRDLARLAVSIDGLNAEFFYHHPAFQDDQELMEVACAQDGKALAFASDNLRLYCTRLQIIALANKPLSGKLTLWSGVDRYKSVCATIRSAVLEHGRFMQFMFCSHDFAGEEGNPLPKRSRRNVLHKLPNGSNFTTSFRKEVAEYLGAPLGQWWVTIRRANANIGRLSRS
jgi:hypothetical protein